MQLVKIETRYTNEKKEEKVGYDLAILLDNGVYIKIRPCFKEDYRVLKSLAEEYKR